jgi:hypothetical protein
MIRRRGRRRRGEDGQTVPARRSRAPTGFSSRPRRPGAGSGRGGR